MKKAALLAAVLLLVMAASALAAPPAQGPRIMYSGMCAYDSQTGTVLVDTFICVSNPNPQILNGVTITIYDMNGGIVYEGPLLLQMGVPSPNIPMNGWRWTTIGTCLAMAGYIPPEGSSMTKYNFLIWWTLPTAIPNRFAVVEVKQILYTTAQHPYDVWAAGTQGMIKGWSETALGGKLTVGTYQK